MRASRLLRILLILQNRGRQSARQLAGELEVSPRTIQRDIEALEAAGLPVVVSRGPQGGVELGFNYRTRLTGLARDEARAIGVLLAYPTPLIDALGLGDAVARARSKLMESFPDKVRSEAVAAQASVMLESQDGEPVADERIAALAAAIHERRIVVINPGDVEPQTIHPQRLVHSDGDWGVQDAISDRTIRLSDIGRVNISAKRY